MGVLKLSMSVSKLDFLYLEYGLCLCCFSEIISALNQRFEFAFTLTFLMRATEAIALTDLYTKPKQHLHSYIQLV